MIDGHKTAGIILPDRSTKEKFSSPFFQPLHTRIGTQCLTAEIRASIKDSQAVFTMYVFLVEKQTITRQSLKAFIYFAITVN